MNKNVVNMLKEQINAGKFSSNNELVNAIRELFNQLRMIANDNPLLSNFMDDNNYVEFTKSVTEELIEYYKNYKEEQNKDITLAEANIEGQKIDDNQIKEVRTDDETYYTVKDNDGDYSLYTTNDEQLVNQITEASMASGGDVTEVAKDILEEQKVEVKLTDLDEFEKERGLTIEDHEQALLARSMEAYTNQNMAVNAEHDIILNTESGELSKIDIDGKVMTYNSSSIDEPSLTTSEQFTFSNDKINALSIEDIDLILRDPDKYNLSEETVEELRRAKSAKLLEAPKNEMEIPFQKTLKPPTNFKTSAFVDILLVALTSLGFSAIILIRLIIMAGI